MSDSVMVDGHGGGGGGGGGASAVPMGNGDGGVANNSDADKVVYRKPRNRGGGAGGAKERFTNPNGVFSRPKSEYISPSGISTLDIRTRLRITEAELAIVQREVSDLLAERNILEASARQYEDSWKFTLGEFGRVVEERDDLQRRLEIVDQVAAAHQQPTDQPRGRKIKTSKSLLEHIKLQLDTQTRVSESLEHERDKAYDDYQMAQAQLHTLIRQYQDLSSTCSEVARERDKAKAEVQLLREDLHRFEPDSDNFSSGRNSLRKVDGAGGSAGSLSSIGASSSGDPDENQSSDPQVLNQQLKEMKDERDRLQKRYEQAMKRAEQYQKQLYRAEEDRRQALATSEALTALWQKKFEKAQNENYDLRQELLSAQDRISHLHDRLAMSRLQSRGNTPSRPSPPDGGVGGDFGGGGGGGPHGTGGGPAHYEMYGRHSPTKAAYGGRGLLNMTQPHRAASFHEHRNQGSGPYSLSQSAMMSTPMSAGPSSTSSSYFGSLSQNPNSVGDWSNSGGGGAGSSTRPIFRTSSLKTSHELISPSSQSSAASMHSAASYNKAKEFRFDELDEDGSHSDEDEEEDDNDNGSWI